MSAATTLDERLAALGIAVDSLRARGLTPYDEASELQVAEVGSDGRGHRLIPAAAKAWKSLKLEARRDGEVILIVSAFRGVERQMAQRGGIRFQKNDKWSKVARLSVSSLYLPGIQTYFGYGIVIFDPRHATRLSELSAGEREALWSDIHAAHLAIERVTKPDHVNVASLGNLVPHLHWHIIPRYVGDSRWGGPIWTTKEEEMEVVRLSDDEHRKLVAAIRAELASSAR